MDDEAVNTENFREHQSGFHIVKNWQYQIEEERLFKRLELKLTIQDLFSSVSDDLRVGEEALIESTQALILPPPPPVSSFLNEGFAQIIGAPPPGAARDLGTACGKRAGSHRDTTISMLKPDLASEITTFWFVILIANHTCMIYTNEIKYIKRRPRP